MKWTREEFEQDRQRYQGELDSLLAQGFQEGHPLVERQRRRIETVDRVLTDPAYGLAECDTGSSAGGDDRG
jgi:hypothetical protein